jgi:hypothetical protein
VTEFLPVEGYSPTEIHRRLRSVYGEYAINVRSVRLWFLPFKSSDKDAGDWPRSGRPAAAATTETKNRVNVYFVSQLLMQYASISTSFSKLAKDIQLQQSH